MAGWYHRLNGHEFEQTSGDTEGRESLVRYRPWGCKQSDTTYQLNNNSIIIAVLLLQTLIQKRKYRPLSWQGET